MTVKSVASSVFAVFLCLAAGAGPVSALEEPWHKRAVRKITRRAAPSEPPPVRKPVAPARRPASTPRSFLHTPTREFKKTPGSRTADERVAEFETLTSDGYDGPDLSKERTPQEENMIRKFPLPPPRVPQPPRTPPTPDRYAGPPRPAEDTTSGGQ